MLREELHTHLREGANPSGLRGTKAEETAQVWAHSWHPSYHVLGLDTFKPQY